MHRGHVLIIYLGGILWRLQCVIDELEEEREKLHRLVIQTRRAAVSDKEAIIKQSIKVDKTVLKVQEAMIKKAEHLPRLS
jgi:hypothetical protein